MLDTPAGGTIGIAISSGHSSDLEAFLADAMPNVESSQFDFAPLRHWPRGGAARRSDRATTLWWTSDRTGTSVPHVRRRELIKLEHENWIAYLSGVVDCASRADVVRTGGVVAILTDLPFDWFNQILVEDDDATPEDLLTGITLARAHRHPFVIRLRDGIDDRFVPTLVAAGFVAEPHGVATPGMVASLRGRRFAPPSATTGLEIRLVNDRAGIEAHREVVTAGFGSHPAVAVGTACPDLLDRSGCAIYVGYADGRPVTSGLGWRTGRTVGVYSIATAPSARRRGYAAAMTVRVMADGAAAGCDNASLQASDMGRPIYERLGFRAVVRYVAYVGRDRAISDPRLPTADARRTSAGGSGPAA